MDIHGLESGVAVAYPQRSRDALEYLEKRGMLAMLTSIPFLRAGKGSSSEISR